MSKAQLKEDDHGRNEAVAQLGSIHTLAMNWRATMDKDYDLQEAAENAIHEDALSVEVRSGWQVVGQKFEATEYNILLCTGGPAVRIIGELDQHNEPFSAALEYQDWGTPWTRYPCTADDLNALMTYAERFYYGE